MNDPIDNFHYLFTYKKKSTREREQQKEEHRNYINFLFNLQRLYIVHRFKFFSTSTTTQVETAFSHRRQ